MHSLIRCLYIHVSGLIEKQCITRYKENLNMSYNIRHGIYSGVLLLSIFKIILHKYHFNKHSDSDQLLYIAQTIYQETSG
jgi:hypothetical protein